MTTVYFAEPVDQDARTPNETWFRNLMHDMLRDRGWAVYRPANAWTTLDVDQSIARTIERINRTALDEADLLVARLPEGVASVGVPMEIEYATRVLGIPAIVVGVGGVALLGNPLVIPISGSNAHEYANLIRTLDLSAKIDRTRFEHTGYLSPRSYEGDAGIDLTTSEAMIVPAGQAVKIPTGNRFAFPQGVWGWVVARSSTYNQYGLTILPGIIDEGYTGELFATALNMTNEPVKIEAGDRLCQIVLFDNVTKRYIPTQVDAIVERDRGSNGFGSTGKSSAEIVESLGLPEDSLA